MICFNTEKEREPSRAKDSCKTNGFGVAEGLMISKDPGKVEDPGNLGSRVRNSL